DLGVSLTPVRGAFNRLISEGLLEHYPGLGVLVPTPSRREIAEIYEFREAVECAAAAKVCECPDPAVLDAMAAAIDLEESMLNEHGPAMVAEMQRRNGEGSECGLLERWRRIDEEFHLAYIRAARNRRMLETVEDLRVRGQMVYERLVETPIESWKHTIEEHRQILDAFRRADAEEARRLIAEYIRLACRELLDAHERQYMERPYGLHSGLHRPEGNGPAGRPSAATERL
ncbi:hypothetical protein LCGC14_2955640, partial [marine sediment metagenome]